MIILTIRYYIQILYEIIPYKLHVQDPHHSSVTSGELLSINLFLLLIIIKLKFNTTVLTVFQPFYINTKIKYPPCDDKPFTVHSSRAKIK